MAPPYMPRSVALAGRARGIPGDEEREQTLGGAVAEFFSHPQADQGAPEYGGDPRLAAGFELGGAPIAPDQAAKTADRAAAATHAAGTAASARTDPAGGTAQGASQPYRGTGTVGSGTATTGGVTTGAPGKPGAAGAAVPAPPRMKVKIPGVGWSEYDPNDPTVAAAFEQARGGKPDSFMMHRDRTAAPAPARAEAPYKPPAPNETYSEVPLAAQLENWNTYVRGREATEQAHRTAIETARGAEETGRATAARARELTAEPFYAEDLAAAAKIGEARIKAATEKAGREDIKLTMDKAVAAIDKLHSDPKFAALSSADKKQLEDQIWDEARLSLSAFTRTNLYPRPDPYAFLNMGGPPAPTSETKPAT